MKPMNKLEEIWTVRKLSKIDPYHAQSFYDSLSHPSARVDDAMVSRFSKSIYYVRNEPSLATIIKVLNKDKHAINAPVISDSTRLEIAENNEKIIGFINPHKISIVMVERLVDLATTNRSAQKIFKAANYHSEIEDEVKLKLVLKFGKEPFKDSFYHTKSE